MGGMTFFNEGKGSSPGNVFRELVEDALYDYGHAGYTGTIGEKDQYVMIELPDGYSDPRAYADKLIEEGDPRVDDKWGPAGCIKTGEDEYLFFGWASS